MYGWYLVKLQKTGIIVIQLRKFLTQKCLQGQKQWNYLENHYPWHIEEKKRTYYQPGSRGSVAYKELEKGKAQQT